MGGIRRDGPRDRVGFFDVIRGPDELGGGGGDGGDGVGVSVGSDSGESECGG